MQSVIDLGLELLVDGSAIRNPYLRLMTAAVGQTLAPGSPWVAVDKRVAALCCMPADDEPRDGIAVPVPEADPAAYDAAQAW